MQILTKGDGSRDFDLLDENDWYGITLSGGATRSAHTEPNAIEPTKRIAKLAQAREAGAKTWVSFEPVLDTEYVFSAIRLWYLAFDKVKIGKLNYHPSKINWENFGNCAEHICKALGVNYYIKDSLRKEMEKAQVEE